MSNNTPNWEITIDGALFATAQQWDGAHLDTSAVSPNSSSGYVINTQHPRGVSDFLHIALANNGYDARGGFTVREISPTLHRVWAIPAPYQHGTGQKEEFTGISITRLPSPASLTAEDRIACCTCPARDAGYAHTEMHTAACAVSVTPSA